MKTRLSNFFGLFYNNNNKEDEQKKQSQENVILEYLKSGKTISQLEATRKFNYIRLSAIIYSLKKKGHCISCEIVYPKKGTKYGLYKLHE